MGYRIGSFNCLNFGKNETKKDAQLFADIIERECFDIIALQEIKNQGALKRLLQALSSNWTGEFDNNPRVNDYAFIWNRNRVALATYEEPGIRREYAPRIYNQYRVDRKIGQKDLVRNPYYARFFPVGGCAPFIELRIINTHIRFSKKEKEKAAGEGKSAVLMRKNEFDVLTKAIYAKEADKRYGNNRPAYTILLGDYNLNLLASGAKSPYLLESFEIVDGQSTKIITTIQTELTTLKKSNTQQQNEQEDSAESDDDDSAENNDSSFENILGPCENADPFSSNFDHFTFDANRFTGVSLSCSRINTVEKYCDGDYVKHRDNISDHVPVVLDLSLSKG